MNQLQQLFPSADGNVEQREKILGYINTIFTNIDELKDPSKLTLGQMPNYTKDYYNRIIEESNVPRKGLPMEVTITELIDLAKGQRFVNSNYVANAAPLPNIASILGNLVMVLLNGNALWDVEGSGAAKAEIMVTSMLSKIVGYDQNTSAGYTTWGGQGAVFNSLRLAVARQFPESNKEGVPNNIFCFCSELSHYSLYKSVEATGIGVNNMIRVEVNDDHSMNLEDLKMKMEKVISEGGIPAYILATMGTTDTFGIDDIKGIKAITSELEQKYNLKPIYVHADSAMGGMYTFFNEYDFANNPLHLEDSVSSVLKRYQQKFQSIHLADSMVFDFHKLGQTPYITSLFLVKNKEDLRYIDLDASETPYVGNRGYGSYHTSYTLECSRMGSAISIYASLLSMGIEGYQSLLANYIRVNIAFRESLLREFKNVAVTNEVSPVTTFRFYPNEVLWKEELGGKLTRDEVVEINEYNGEFAELIGVERERVYFGNTSKQRLIHVRDGDKRLPVYVHKFFSISPYTTIEEVDRYISFLKEHMNVHQKSLVLV
ncbi:pyridoxal phosphate-dependent decarboxylase family protein [Bacillus songklensis]|uniref:Pyridoxal phosphate-dependent decarboxylase family protein n=1 Tax=Bacillus songklensis TaxID=1069116 RepID=A0ABV8B3U3_9BACI